MVSHTTADGVWGEGPNYAAHRFAGQRDSKYLLMDVCEFTKTGEFYARPLYRNLYEWIFGYAWTPSHRGYTFGDTQPNSRLDNTGSAPFRAYRLGEKAGRYAAFRLKAIKATTPPPRFHTYVLMAQRLPEPLKPTSRIFRDGAACFVEDDQTEASLAGVLWNCTKRGWHTHSDVNAVHLCAYGESILQNSGYCGAGTGRMGYSWDYISHEARANNTLLIDGKNHRIGRICANKGDWWHDPKLDGPHTKRGAGITEGFTSVRLDYASGYSGKVLLDGTHERNFVFVHPQDGVAGYFVLFDEVEANQPTAQVNLVLHPNSHEEAEGAGCTTLRDGQEYAWEIDGNVRHRRDHQVNVSVFLGLAPTKVELPPGLLSAWGSDRWQTIGRYLYATFETDQRGRVNIPTVIFPFDRDHPKPAMARISSPGLSGISIAHGKKVRDLAIAVSPGSNEPVSVEGVTFHGRSALLRRRGTGMDFYFSRKARRLLCAAAKVGFESDQPVSIHLKRPLGRIACPKSRITLHYPGITGVEVAGKPVRPLTTTADSATDRGRDGPFGPPPAQIRT